MTRVNPGIPRPFPDELLYSIIARAARYLGHWSPKGLLDAVYGCRGILASPDLPGSLALIEELALNTWGMTLEELALRHTLVGYYTHFLGSAERHVIVKAMARTSAHLQVRLGICASVVCSVASFRLCPACVEEDLQRYGETYWRRAHHLPGALVCAHHGVSLYACAVPFRPLGRYEHVAALPAMLKGGSGPLLSRSNDLPAAMALACDGMVLLDAAPAPGGPCHDYRVPLAALDYQGRHGGLARLREDFRENWGGNLLETLFKPGTSGNYLTWLAEVMRKPRRPLDPLKHILLRRFLSSAAVARAEQDRAHQSTKTWGIYRLDALRQEAASLQKFGLTINAVANALDIDWKTANRLVTPLPAAANLHSLHHMDEDRSSWLALAHAQAIASRSELRRQDPALYARLYRRDKAWLMEQHCAPGRRSAAISRVNWNARDHALSSRIRNEIVHVLRRSPPVRASRHRVLGALDKRALIAHFGHKLPLSTAALDTECETVQAFQVRRLAAVLRRAPNAAWLASWQALRTASINSARLPDGGRFLLDAAWRVNRTAQNYKVVP